MIAIVGSDGSQKAFAMQFADRVIRIRFFSEVADDHVEPIKILASQSFVPIAGSYHIVAESAQHVSQRGPQPFVIVDNEDPEFLHQSPTRSSFGEGRKSE